MAEFSRKGLTLGFGLISTQVRLTGAVEKETTPKLNTLCVGNEKHPGVGHDPIAVKQGYACTTCGTLTDKTVLVKGKPVGDGFAVVAADDMAAARAETGTQYKKEIKFTAHPAGEVIEGTAPNGTLYYLAPEGGTEPYVLLRDLIHRHPEVAFVALYTVTSRVGMFVARVHGDAIVLEGRYRESELKAAPGIDQTPANEQLFGLAEQFLNTQTTTFDADLYEDQYAARITEMLEASAPVAAAAMETAGGVVSGDLMAALQAEIDKNAVSS